MWPQAYILYTLYAVKLYTKRTKGTELKFQFISVASKQCPAQKK